MLIKAYELTSMHRLCERIYTLISGSISLEVILGVSAVGICELFKDICFVKILTFVEHKFCSKGT